MQRKLIYLTPEVKVVSYEPADLLCTSTDSGYNSLGIQPLEDVMGEW